MARMDLDRGWEGDVEISTQLPQLSGLDLRRDYSGLPDVLHGMEDYVNGTLPQGEELT